MKLSSKTFAALTVSAMLFTAFPTAFAAVQTPITLNSATPAARSDFAAKLQKYLDAGDFAGALALFDGLSSDLANDFEILFLKASILFSAGKLDDADALCTRLLSVQSDNLDVLELRSMIAKFRGDTRKRAADLKAILSKDPQNVQANIELGEDYALSKDYASARKCYRNAMLKDPTNTDALFGYGQTSYYTGDISSAKTTFERMLKIDPKNASAHAYLGKLAAENDNYKDAEAYIVKAVEYEPNNYDYRLDYGSYAKTRGKKDVAEEQWKIAVELRPDYFLAYTYLAGLYDEQERFENELSMWKKVVETNPKYFYAYEAMGILYWHKGEFINSRNSFLKAASYNPKNESYPMMVAATYYRQNEKDSYQKCKTYLNTVLKNFRENKAIYSVMRMYLENGGGVNAEAAAERAVKAETNKTTRGKMYFYLALFYDMKGSRELAEQLYSQVTNIAAPLFFEYRLAEWSTQ